MLKKIIKNSLLCIKYPFLYPRNRWTGKNHVHYDWISKLYNKYYNKAYFEVGLGYKFYKNPEQCTETNNSCLINNKFKVLYKDGYITIIGGIKPVTFNLQKHVGNDFQIKGITLTKSLFNKPIIQYHVCKKTNTNYGFCHKTLIIKISNYYENCYKLVQWFWRNVLDKVCIWPVSNELNAMPEGWRKAFGLQMCDEIKKELKKYNYLYSYRITQIKEKYGTLRWYDAGAPKSVCDIIHKYMGISWNTCIVCGKPSKYITSGYISPYCEDCCPQKIDDCEQYKDENGNWRYINHDIEESNKDCE